MRKAEGNAAKQDESHATREDCPVPAKEIGSEKYFLEIG